MSYVLPDRLSVSPRSPYYDAEILARGIGIRFNGVEKTTVEESCISANQGESKGSPFRRRCQRA